jgi:hypothetical protein
VDLAKHLTDKDIERVVEILDGWRDQLTWEALCDACLPIIDTKPARQTVWDNNKTAHAFWETAIGGFTKKKIIPTRREYQGHDGLLVYKFDSA